MRGYDSTSYGRGFADVYDEWYADVTDADATVRLVLDLVARNQPADGTRGISETDGAGTTEEQRRRAGRVLELGVGTGRLAIPMAQAGLTVVGIDSSQEMLDRLHTNRPSTADGSPATDVTTIRGDMVTDLPDGPFDVALAAYNTLFNLLGVDEQRACFAAVAARLAPGGRFVVEAVVPDDEAPEGPAVTVRTMAADRVVLSISDHRPDEHRTIGQFVELTEAGGVRLRPWAIRWSTPAELDAMASEAGLTMEARFGDMTLRRFDDTSDHHVTVYELAGRGEIDATEPRGADTVNR